ncbi:DNA-binding LacI/PurR family transcriptional regulator [Arcanobacterium pluranimalium]|uniref:LacI family DNA-binding transcriptional regulator n=1 Tax=Arcanobacterium pluranimalium TaxID=108028 RepID=UPI0019578C9D|nr:LacI family DNA-binding transcriptional regulator [Arcanobacterium pluranimalium]MBM7824989.1 DNA-binding LacI/PurR family transcriptional regulator [Arcanobacterium pluranimalium]
MTDISVLRKTYENHVPAQKSQLTSKIMESMMTNVAIRDIAKHAGVSPATVSRVLNSSKPVADELRRRVEKAITELDYQPSRVARNLRRSRTDTIGFVVSSIQNPFFPTLIEQATEIAERHNFAVNVTISHTPLKAAYDLFRAPMVDGVLLVGGQPELDAQQLLSSSHKMPIVAIDREVDGVALPRFSATNERGAFEVVQHMLGALRTNPKRFVHIQGPQNFSITKQRQRGVIAACREAQIPDEALVTTEGDFTAQSGHDVVAELFAGEKNQWPQAIFADNDLMAIGAIKAAKQAGAVVGTDVLIAGFDGLDMGQWITPTLTSYRQPIREITAAAVECLIGLINSDGKANTTKDFEFAGELVIRNSTGGTQ